MRLRGFLPKLPQVLAQVSRDANIPVEAGQPQINRDAHIPVEAGQSQIQRDANIPVESIGSVSRDANIPLEATATVNRNANIPVEMAGNSIFSLAHAWNVRQHFTSSLFHDWNVLPKIFAGSSLTHQWLVHAGIFNGSLTHTWRVIPNLPAAFSNDVQQPTATISGTPAITAKVKIVNIDSTVELMADHYSAEVIPGSDLFINANFANRITFAFGLLDGSGNPLTITHIKDGVIDEYELRARPNTQILNLRGRDAMALVLDCEFDKTYIRAGYLANGQYDEATQSQIQAAGPKTIQMNGSTISIPALKFAVGHFTAKQIAQDVAKQVGLDLVWQVRDYELQSTFTASGRAIDTIRKLVEPWTQVEQYRADVFMQGKTIIIRHRQLPTAPFKADYTFDISQMRRSELTLRKRFTREIGVLTLVGRLEPVATNFLTVINSDGEDEVEVVQETIVPPTGADPTEKRIVTATRYLVPQQLVTRQFKDVYAPHRVEHSETFNEYDDSEVGKLLRKSTTTTDKWDEDISSLAAFERTTQYNTYDDITFLLRNQTTVFESAPSVSGLANYVASKMITKIIYDVAPNMCEERITEYAPSAGMSDGAAAASSSAFWDIVRQDSQIQAGHRAGGSGRKTIFIPNFPGSSTNVEVRTVLNTLPCDAPFSYSNPNLSLQDLQFLNSLFVAADAFDFEWEVMFTGVAMPWLQKGLIIQITGFTDADGNPVTLPPVYITEARSTYDESKKDASYTTQCRAFAWT